MGKPKYILGATSRGGEDQGLSVEIGWATDEGYDIVTDIVDLDGEEQFVTKKFYSKKIDLKYSSTKESGSKRYRLYFKSGDTEELVIIIPQGGRGHTELIDITPRTVKGAASSFQARFEGSYPIDKFLAPSQVAVMAHNDPAKVYSYEKIWLSGGGKTAFLHDTVDIQRHWKLDGGSGGVPSTSTSSVQYATFIHVLNSSEVFDSPSDLFANSLEDDGSPVTTTFLWAKDLSPLSQEENTKTFNVCDDYSSPSYFRTTGLDSDGATIPDNYLNGKYPAIWACGACAVDCDTFEADVVQTINDGEQKIVTATIRGNAATPNQKNATKIKASTQQAYPTYPVLGLSAFTYELIVPQGTNYGGTTLYASVNDTSKAWSDLPYSPLPYQIKITDDTTGCIKYIDFLFTDPLFSKSRNCFCGTPGAFNYEPGVHGDSCNICISCVGSVFSIGTSPSIPAQGALILNNGSYTVNESLFGANDGSVVFQGQVNPLMPQNLSLLFDMFLYSVPDLVTAISTPPIEAAIGESSPNYLFSGLAPGFYAVVAMVNGESCLSEYRFEVTAALPVEVTDCVADAIFNVVDPCQGTVSVDIINPSQSEVSVEYTVDWNPVQAPFTVGVGQTMQVTITFADITCQTQTISHLFTEVDFPCIVDPPKEIPGCTHDNASNYNPEATVDDGSCIPYIPGCMDPAYGNYNPLATLDNGSCVNIYGCTDPLAGNYNENADIDDGSCIPNCTEPVFTSGYTVSGNIANVVVLTAITNYTITWHNPSTGVSFTTEDTLTSPVLADGVWIATIITALGCPDVLIINVNSTLIFGCMDGHALNFSPSATVPIQYWTPLYVGAEIVSEACAYQLTPSPCVPSEIELIDKNINSCLSTLTTKYLTQLKAGMLSDCKDKDVRLLHLIQYLFSRRGLECLYNCSDSLSPSIDEVNCVDVWTEGGPSGASLTWTANTTYVLGDIVKHPISGIVYRYTFPHPPQSQYTPSPETAAGDRVWETCGNIEIPSDNTNRIDAYLAFIQEACKECGLPGAPPVGTPSTPEQSETGTTMDGERMGFDGNEPNFD